MAKFKDIIDKEGTFLEFDKIDTRYNIEKIGGTPCRIACPAGVNVKSYLGLIAAGKYEQALEVVKRTNPLPGICGRVCTYPCESDCRRNEVDDPVAIRALKRFIADYEHEHRKDHRPQPKRKKKKIDFKKKYVAIIGSGPAGLTAANDLIRKGYGVTIFEEQPVAGGMLSVGIPPYRLPQEIIQTEIESVIDLGVKIEIDTRIDDFEKLLKTGYNSVFIAIGAHKSLKLNIPGEEFTGVLDCLSYLKKINLGKREKPGNKVIVIGGGNAAIDSARASLRLGVDDVRIVYRRSKKEMPADEEEIKDAELEGVKIDFLAAPIKVLGDNIKVTGLECVKMRLGEPDESGRRKPIPIKGSEFIIEADVIISAISQKPDISFLPVEQNLKLTKWDTFAVDPETLQTNVAGIFAGGDAVTGPKAVIDAIQSGHFAARSIDNYLSGRDLKADTSGEQVLERRLNISIGGVVIDKEEHIHLPKISLARRRVSFDEVELGLTDEQAVGEAKRCLRCGPCLECVECSSDCSKKLIAMTGDDELDDLLLRVQWIPERFPTAEDPWFGSLRNENEDVPIKMESVVSEVREYLCRGCGKCSELCEYKAISMIYNQNGIYVARVNQNVCRGCGTCAAICPSSAIISKHFTDSFIQENMKRSMKG
ncbi:MAG: FAD-dependent oxidoreductase [Candidatus Cloacimonetes bacterium]|nr:FAD-dependent oxidoreductase [Candidatus Cloacimonadota bacterium]